MPHITGIQDTQHSVTGIAPSSLDMKSELATIQALRAGQAPPGSGTGQTVGQLAGTGAGLAFGGPAGAAAGGIVGGTAGSLVDWFIEKDAKANASKRELTAKRKLLDKEKTRAISTGISDRKARLQGIALSEEEQAMTALDMEKKEREGTMSNLLADLREKKEFEQYLTDSFLEKRKFI